jgi:hypothetical protein
MTHPTAARIAFPTQRTALMRSIPSLVVAICLAAAACSQDAPPDAAAGAQHGSAHAAAGVVPGSHADWCVEHEVPESKCTRCDTSLVAAYKATGDWCAEHGLPESQCVTCDPSRRMTRPPEEAK